MNRRSLYLVAPVLLVAACGGASPSAGPGASPAANGSTSTPSAINASRCIRAHGVPNFPDPNSSGDIPKEGPQQLGVSDAVLQAAQQACQALWPYQPQSLASQQAAMPAYLAFAACMRAHGLPGFPDPTTSSRGIVFVISLSKDGFDPHSAAVLAKVQECLHLLPAGVRPEASEEP
jgi:hypothetical protein